MPTSTLVAPGRANSALKLTRPRLSPAWRSCDLLRLAVPHSRCNRAAQLTASVRRRRTGSS